MLVLIAESKTMTACGNAVGPEVYARHRPLLEDKAERIVEQLRGMTTGELAETVGISAAMAQRLHGMVYDFDCKTTGAAAIEAFTGVVFRAFGYASLSPEARERAGRDVRIISSLYGWLRPEDVVKPYRLDFGTAAAPGGGSVAAFLRGDVTERLLADIDASGCNDVLDLMPAEAARCIDMARVAERARIWKADFRELKPGGGTRTPNSNRLKTLRGLLLRQIAEESIDSPEGLAAAETADYAADAAASEPGRITFVTG